MAKTELSLRETIAVRERSITRQPTDERLLKIRSLLDAANRLLASADDLEVQIDADGRLVLLKRVVTIREVWTPV